VNLHDWQSEILVETIWVVPSSNLGLDRRDCSWLIASACHRRYEVRVRRQREALVGARGPVREAWQCFGLGGSNPALGGPH
jgi:hypothetical protein